MNPIHALAPLALLLAACGGDAPSDLRRGPAGEPVEVRVFSARPVGPDIEIQLADRLEVVSATGAAEACPEATEWCTDGDPGRCCESDFGLICYDCARPMPERARRFEVEVVDASTGTVREDLRVRLKPRPDRPTLRARR